MPYAQTVEERLSALEQEILEIKLHFRPPQPVGDWVECISGSMKDFPEFEQVVRFGQEFRRSDAQTTESCTNET